jgi:hypothetical protein
MLASPISMNTEHADLGDSVEALDWDDAEAMKRHSAGVRGPVLWWGGEACQGEYMGTMHAAVLSGFAAAAGIVKHPSSAHERQLAGGGAGAGVGTTAKE